MNKSILAIAVASLTTHASLSYAEQQVDETMVVTANRFEQTQQSVLASTSVITRDDIEVSQATSALDLLKTLPGVTINSQGSKGNITGIYIRGTSSKHALVIVNGVRINSPTAGEASIGLIPAFAIEKIEVIRGPRAAVYGSDAMGGVISISTVSGSENKHQLLLGYGDQGQEQLGWKSSGQLSESTKGSFVFNQEKSDGYRIYDGAPVDETHGFDSQTVFGSLEHQLTDVWSLSFAGYTQNSEVEYADKYTIGAPSQQTDGDFYSLTGAIHYSLDNFSSALQIGTTKDHNANGDAAGTSAKSTLTGYSKSASWINTYTGLDHVVFNGGVDYLEEQAYRGGSNTDDYDNSKKDNKAAFVTALGEFGDFTAEASARHDNDSVFGGYNTWNVAVGYFLLDQFQLVASSGTAFKAPTFNDLYWPQSGNPDLKPEESSSTEIGVYGYHDFFDWSLVAYRSEFENLIEWAPTGSGQYDPWVPQNVAEAEIEGIELGVNFATGIVEHSVGAEWLDAIDKLSNEALIRRPKHKFSWVPTVRFDKVDASLTVLYTGERYASNSEYLASYTTVDLGIGYRATEQLTLGLRANNLFDEEYQTAVSTHYTGETLYYQGAERSFFATATYQF
ncbi:TonB-dependent receptor [Vibrio sp. ZSDE26]|uniref:Vitamin B12 transporter BtuB n=1 Tax=Vibrio amylolyticus TaxID=2847292 RepID=A0A9X1XRE6_9VIBR|nr:TonB-dependent receptor [Vibrio amylolyticus]MCK6265765.1 TonB-dependent receptor [Vibrio amylolyticus]